MGYYKRINKVLFILNLGIGGACDNSYLPPLQERLSSFFLSVQRLFYQ